MQYLLLPLLTLLSVKPTLAVSAESETDQISNVVIVTGELLSRTVEQSANSVLVIDEQVLKERLDLRSIRDVLRETPNITDVSGTGKAPTVRGVDGTGPAENANAFFAGSRPRLSWQVDGRTASYNEIVFGDIGIWDLERIEVLRGPQSTLVGRNAIAGTVRVETHDPKKEREGALRLEGGNYSQERRSLMYNQPITNTLAVRIVADEFERLSPVDYDSFEGINEPGLIHGHSLRGKILYTSKADHEARLLVSLTDVDYQAPNSEIIVKPFSVQRSNHPQQPVHNPHTSSWGVEFSSLFTDTFKFELSMFATEFEFKRKTAPESSLAEVNTDEQVVEPRLRYTNTSGGEWVAGARVYRARQSEWIQFVGVQKFDDHSNSRAAYVEGLIPMGDRYELTVGFRYEEEDRKRDGGDPTRLVVNIQADETYKALLPKLGLSFSPNEHQVWGGLLSRGYNSGGGGVSFGETIVNYEYGEEYANTLEIYGRQQWLNGKLRTTQNIFYSLYEDMQLPFDLTPENSRDEAFVVRNADAALTIGLEFGASWYIDDHWHLFGNLALLDTEITDYPDSGIEGNALFTAPSASIQLGVTWSADDWLIGVNSHVSDGWYTSITNHPDGEVDPRGTINGSVSYQLFEQVNVYFSVRNILDEDKLVSLYPGTAPEGSGLADRDFDSAVLMQPRTTTVGIKVTF